MAMDFEKAYISYEEKAARGEIRSKNNFRTLALAKNVEHAL